MRSSVRKYISACFYYSGLVDLFRWWTQGSKRRLIILYYHQAAGGDLRSHMLYLLRHYRMLHLETALEELYLPLEKEVQRGDRRPLLALTFDDGYNDNYTHAFPLACELHIPITIFLIPGYVEYGNSFWWSDRLLRLAQVDQVRLEGRAYRMSQHEERKALAQNINVRANQAASTAERKVFLDSLCKALAVPSSVIPKEEPVPLVNWTQVREMKESGWVSFGAHTMHHSDLANLTDPTRVLWEVGECRTVLEQYLGCPVRTFAYPHGLIGEYGLAAVKQAGYHWAVTTLPGFNTCLGDPYLLLRRGVNVDQHWLVVAAETAGVWLFLSHLKKIAVLLIRKSFSILRGLSKLVLSRGCQTYESLEG